MIEEAGRPPVGTAGAMAASPRVGRRASTDVAGLKHTTSPSGLAHGMTVDEVARTAFLHHVYIGRMAEYRSVFSARNISQHSTLY